MRACCLANNKTKGPWNRMIEFSRSTLYFIFQFFMGRGDGVHVCYCSFGSTQNFNSNNGLSVFIPQSQLILWKNSILTKQCSQKGVNNLTGIDHRRNDQFRFIWTKDSNNQKKIHYLAWNHLCRINEDGLRVRAQNPNSHRIFSYGLYHDLV